MDSDASAITPAEPAAIAITAAELDSLPLSAWWESRGLSRASAFRLVKIAGISPGRVKVPYSRLPVASLTAEQVAQLDPLAHRLRNGATLPQLEAELTTAMVAAESPSDHASDDLSPSAPAVDAAALLARLEAGERAIATGLPLSTAEMAWLLQARPGGDRVTRAGVEAIRHGRNCWQLRRAQSV